MEDINQDVSWLIYIFVGDPIIGCDQEWLRWYTEGDPACELDEYVWFEEDNWFEVDEELPQEDIQKIWNRIRLNIINFIIKFFVMSKQLPT